MLASLLLSTAMFRSASRLVTASILLGCPSTIEDPSAATDAVCENPEFTCAPSCAGGECGPLEPFDANGCLRLPCTADDECPSGQVCYTPALFGDCDVSNIIECAPEPGGCVCTNSSAPVEGFCVDEDDRPTKEADDCGCGCNCGDPGSHSTPMDDVCRCDAGYVFCVPDDPDDYTCCLP